MEQSNEPITAYGLMFGPPLDATLAEIDQAFRSVPAQSLFQLAGLGVVLGTAFDLAFGGGDLRTRAVAATTFGPVALELDSRGIRYPDRTPEFMSAFEDWLVAMAASGPDIETIPTHRLVSMRATIWEAGARLGPGDPDVTVRLQQALDAVTRVLQQRGTRLELLRPPLPIAKVDRHPVSAFIAYSHADTRYRNALVTHLSPLKRRGQIAEWHDRMIVAGQEWEAVIDEHLEGAGMILPLVSADFIASEYAYGKEMRRALERHEAGEAIVVPIIVRPVHWQTEPFSRLQMLPERARPVTEWSNRDSAWINVVAGINEAIGQLRDRSR